MIDFSDVSFLIPVRLDSINRLENILTSIEFLLSHFKTNVIVLEASRYNNSILQKLLPHDVKYLFVEDWDPIFHRTKYINQLFAESHTHCIYMGCRYCHSSLSNDGSYSGITKWKF